MKTSAPAALEITRATRRTTAMWSATTRKPGAEGFGIASWYMLVSRVTTGSSQLSALKAPPFLYFNGADNAAIQSQLNDPGWQRTLSLIRKPSEFVMIVEAGDSNLDGPSRPKAPSTRTSV